MNDTLKMFLIALITSVLVQFLLLPQIMKMQGWRQPAAAGAVQAPPIVPPVTAAPVGPAPTGPATPSPDNPAMVNAPDYRGIPIKTARSLASSQGIVIIEDGQKPAADKATGEIVEQQPPPGTPMASRELRVVTASAAAIVDIPDVTGKGIEEAKKALEDAGFAVPEPIQKGSEKTPGTVLGQTPKAGEKAATGSEIKLEIASLPQIEVPKVTGKYLNRAKKILRDAGLEVGKRKVREHEEHGQNYVLGQEPAAGSKVPFGSAIDLTVVAPN